VGLVRVQDPARAQLRACSGGAVCWLAFEYLPTPTFPSPSPALPLQGGPSVALDKLLNWATMPYPPSPLARPDWGVIVDVWGGVDVCGLVGSTTDSQGYGFALNTYTTAAALLPVARYNASYAATLAAYALCVASSARLFLAPYSDKAQQVKGGWVCGGGAALGVGGPGNDWWRWPWGRPRE
jgi:hypothetical protein